MRCYERNYIISIRSLFIYFNKILIHLRSLALLYNFKTWLHMKCCNWYRLPRVFIHPCYFIACVYERYIIIYMCTCPIAMLNTILLWFVFTFSREIPILFLDIWSCQLDRFTRPTISHGLGICGLKWFIQHYSTCTPRNQDLQTGD